VALNTTEDSYVSLDGRRIINTLGAYDDKLIRDSGTLTDAVHREGGKISFSYLNAGRECSLRSLEFNLWHLPA